MVGKQWLGRALVVVLGTAAPLAAQTAHSGKVSRGDPEAGADLYKRQCVMCHSTEAGVKIVGPSLHGEMKPPHAKPAAEVRQQIEVGKGLMPSFRNKLDDQQINDLIAYIRSL